VNDAATLEGLYALNATLLLGHEIDSAYWREWELFHLPGGIQLFVFLHLLLLPLVLYGYREVCRRGARARVASLLLASIGMGAALLHAAFLLSGDARFTLLMSVLLLKAIFVVSLLQLIIALRLPGGAQRA
jgi:hypothetical protein